MHIYTPGDESRNHFPFYFFPLQELTILLTERPKTLLSPRFEICFLDDGPIHLFYLPKVSSQGQSFSYSIFSITYCWKMFQRQSFTQNNCGVAGLPPFFGHSYICRSSTTTWEQPLLDADSGDAAFALSTSTASISLCPKHVEC